MTKGEEITAGFDIEKEHKPTYEWLSSYLEEFGKLPPEDDFYISIVSDHMEEHKDYYTKLIQAGL